MSKLVQVGIIGCGEVAQIVHIPNLNNLSDFFRITYLCDVSQESLEHCKKKVNHFSSPKTTRSPEELCSSNDVDVVLVLSSTQFHAQHAVLALKNDKITFVEKPMAINERDVKLVLGAKRASKGTVMVGYMRRYATAFVDAIREIGSMDQIRYATVRDIIGTNALFTPQSGMFPKYFRDVSKEDRRESQKALDEMNTKALQDDLGLDVDDHTETMWRWICSLGSHDLSAMREALGMPQKVLGCSLSSRDLFWSALFQYPGFAVYYESGVHDVPLFDAHIEIFSEKKQVKVKYDTPFIKGVPVTLTIREDMDGTGALRETVERRTYEDPYTLEMRELYALAAEGKPVKTTAEDAAQDLKIFQMIMKAGTTQATL